MAQALYRKHRSASFDELVGQGVISTTLRNQVQRGTVAQAYLFTGIRGTGKTSTARILARAVNCMSPVNGEPCNTCEACVSILDGTAMDVLEIDAASNRGIDEMRNLREKVHFLPAMLQRKVYIIDEAHMLTTEAWNAFLKTLEEPPKHILFILATTDPQRVPETVRSRVQRFDFRRLSLEELTTLCQSVAVDESIPLSKAAAMVLAHAAHGSARDALSLLEYVAAFVEGDGAELSDAMVRESLGIADPATVAHLVGAILEHDASAVISGLETAFGQGVEPRQLLHQIGEVATAGALKSFGATARADGLLIPNVLGSAGASRNWLMIVEAVTARETTLRHALDARMEVELTLLKLVATPEGEESHSVPVPAESRIDESRAPQAQIPTHAPEVIATPKRPQHALASVQQTHHHHQPITNIPEIVDQPLQQTTEVPVREQADASTEPATTSSQGHGQHAAVWSTLIDIVQKKDPMTAGVLRSCILLGIEGGTARINAPFTFHYERLIAPDKMLLLEAAAGSADPTIEKIVVTFGVPDAIEEQDLSPLAQDASAAVLDTFPGSTIVASRLRDPSSERT